MVSLVLREAKLYRETRGIKYFYGMKDRNLQQFWDQGSKNWVKKRDQFEKNIPCYYPVNRDGHRRPKLSV